MEVLIRKRGRPRMRPIVDYYEKWKTKSGLPVKVVQPNPVAKHKLMKLRAKRNSLSKMDEAQVDQIPLKDMWTRQDQNEVETLEQSLIEEKRFIRFARKMEKHIVSGQYVDGRFFCKSGKHISDERIKKYEPLCHKLIREYFPAMAIWEAGFCYEDLINQCRLEIFLALLNGFDPKKAMSSTMPDPKKRAAQEAKKQSDPATALANAEFSIVYGRIDNYLRRNAYRFHPDQLGGRSVSSVAMLCHGLKNGSYTGPIEDLALSPRAEITREKLLAILEQEGAEAAREMYLDLKVSHAKELLDLLSTNKIHLDDIYMGEL